MRKIFFAFMSAVLVLSQTAVPADACTSIILKAKDGSRIYGRTCEWGVFDTKSGLVMVPRNLTFTSKLDGGKSGMTWKNRYGYVAINALNLPFYLDGMNEAGLTVGGLYLPGFAEYQTVKPSHEAHTINNLDFIGYVLGRFSTVEEIKSELPKIYVTDGKGLIKESGVPMPLHYVALDSTGKSIVIEYTGGKLNIYDNDIGVMTNSPTYDWHLTNLRNYANLTPYGEPSGDRKTEGVNVTPLSGGSGMMGLPGDYSSASRFVRAFFYTQTSVPLENVNDAINQASRILDNFDYPKGFERTGTPDKYVLGYTQWSVIGDVINKRYYWWTEWNREMQMADLTKLDFDAKEIIAIPLDKVRTESVIDRTGDFSTKNK